MYVCKVSGNGIDHALLTWFPFQLLSIEKSPIENSSTKAIYISVKNYMASDGPIDA